MTTALIVGITGQCGSWMADLLLEKGYTVHGIIRQSSQASLWRLQPILHRVTLHTADLLDEGSLRVVIGALTPDELYDFGAQSFVANSFHTPIYTSDVTGLGCLRLLETVRQLSPKTRVYHASSSEMFGNVPAPQSETTPFHPVSPYGIAKVFAHQACQYYRRDRQLFVATGIHFNMESERRGFEFVTRKITSGVAKIKSGLETTLALGNLDAKRDWTYCPEAMQAAWQMLHVDTPDDYVIATGMTTSVMDFCHLAFSHVGLDANRYVRVDQQFVRPSELHTLCGNVEKAERVLGWRPTLTVSDICQRMVDYDCTHVNTTHRAGIA